MSEIDFWCLEFGREKDTNLVSDRTAMNIDMLERK
jgi:hypothetical protein